MKVIKDGNRNKNLGAFLSICKLDFSRVKLEFSCGLFIKEKCDAFVCRWKTLKLELIWFMLNWVRLQTLSKKAEIVVMRKNEIKSWSKHHHALWLTLRVINYKIIFNHHNGPPKNRLKKIFRFIFNRLSVSIFLWKIRNAANLKAIFENIADKFDSRNLVFKL